MTISIGGNDAGFSNVIVNCALYCFTCGGAINEADEYIAKAHEVCSSEEWLNGQSNPLEESYHPNVRGQAQLRKEVEAKPLP